MGQSTLYPMLYNLEARGEIAGRRRTAPNGRERKYYALTGKGTRRLRAESEQWGALARAMAMDPEVLFFDEPSAGLDPISSRLLDDLILQLRNSLGATIVMVTHELPSIFAIATNSVFLDPETKSQLAVGDPHDLLARPPDPKVERFLTRGGSDRAAPSNDGGA